jgi:hypothetical protein
MGKVLGPDHDEDHDTPDNGRRTENSTGVPSTEEVGPSGLSTHVANVEDGCAERVLVAGHVHCLFHAEDFGIVERRLVEVLECLGDEEEGEEEHVDPLPDPSVLLYSLRRVSATLHWIIDSTYNLSLSFRLLIRG